MLKVKRLLSQTLIKRGQKGSVEKILLITSKKLLLDFNKSSFFLLFSILKKLRTTLKFKSYRISGVLCKVPVFLRKEQQVKNSLRLLCNNVSNSNNPFVDSFIRELERCNLEQGELFLNRKKIFKLANQNKVFVNFR